MKWKDQSESFWKNKLTADQYLVCRQKGTEAPFTGEYYSSHEKGVYHCVACGNALFDSQAKYDSGSGWPSFFKPVHLEKISENEDTTHGMKRVEVVCAQCESHLGHVFEDGPPPTGRRYCINSITLVLKKPGSDSE